jgi:flagellar biosynthetic protein FliR
VPLAFDLFAPGTPQVLALFGARVGGLVLVAPVFSAKSVPVMVRTGLVVLLAVLLEPVAASSLTSIPALTPGAVASETLVGFALGLGAAILVGAADTAGEFLAMQIGLSGAAVLNPLSNEQGPALGMLMNMFAVALLLSLDAHLVMLDALAASVREVPVGVPLDLRAGLGAMVSTGAALFSLGLRFAAPVIAAVLLGNVALAVLGRAAPQLNILGVAFPVQIAIGLFTLAASLPFIATWFTGWQSAYVTMLSHVMGALTLPLAR